LSNSNGGVKIDARRRPLVVIENKMSRPQTVKVRLTIECEFTRQEVYDALVATSGADGVKEKQMDKVWEWLSSRNLGYTDVSDRVWDENEDTLCDMIKDGLSAVIKEDEAMLDEDEDDKETYQCCSCKKFFDGEPMRVNAYCFCEACHEANKKEVDETNGWEEVYNGGQPRENPRLSGQEGIFYQTYGNGGGAGGWGGYWAMRVSNGQHMPGVYEVCGHEFNMLEGVGLEFRPEDSLRGVVAAVRLVPLTQERIADILRKQALYQQEKQRILKEMADVKERAAVEVEMRQRADRLLRGAAV